MLAYNPTVLQAVHQLEDETRELREAEEHALRERDTHRRTVDELSRQLASIEGERRAEMEQNRQLIAERDDLAVEMRRKEQVHEDEIEHFRGDMEQEVERWRRMISEKEQVNRFPTATDFLLTESARATFAYPRNWNPLEIIWLRRTRTSETCRTLSTSWRVQGGEWETSEASINTPHSWRSIESRGIWQGTRTN